MTHDEYLGDGVYASFDGWHVWLDLRAQDPNVKIALEPVVLAKLVAYAEARGIVIKLPPRLT